MKTLLGEYIEEFNGRPKVRLMSPVALRRWEIVVTAVVGKLVGTLIVVSMFGTGFVN